MTQFVKEQFHWDGMYLTYGMPGDRKFVARFKHRKGDRNSFQKFLIKNFTVEEYFEKAEYPGSPLGALEEKGYLLPHIRKWLREGKIQQYRSKSAADYGIKVLGYCLI